jgi:hypothetical protein
MTHEIKYQVTPDVNTGVKLIALPWLSVGWEISSVANMVTMANHTAESAVARPDRRIHYS